MRKVACVVGVVVLVQGCTSYAANQVLGTSAIPLSVTAGKRLEPKNIYRVKSGGMITQVCQKDMENRKIKAVGVVMGDESDDTITDRVVGEAITLTVPGVPTIRMPYRKMRVQGYTVREAKAPSGEDIYQYYMQNVGSTCRKMMSEGGLIVVQSEARAKKSAQLLKGPVDDLPLGPGTLGGLGTEQVIRGPSNVTFGIVPAEH
ncbi:MULTISPECIES: hypothetical protein [Phyllobacteriaceae]|jgi:tRNA-binding EMAP/Myf-like protein|uniref:Lipoprotein n=1 Tax=Mesorhizobium hungaricum TaxID=1566387 RepID=A0A1C2DJ12_9HYPH|nr:MULTISPECIES: hypothetical protein [Mesorhizobium]MBN9234244.1 hypothetical protein [Mesorhizobium sp.]MDQ0332309.1 tRNA-binding EMAP/Myf-like protein [Mesorhizobium sp. YL-MeA3-2017]OCX14646.1 hypothetical protein QV13_19575 [Mesorhizobium hungaricum]